MSRVCLVLVLGCVLAGCQPMAPKTVLINPHPARADRHFSEGLAWTTGKGRALDYAKGVTQFERAARYGSVDGMYMLGMAFYVGRGITQDYAEAARWLEQAAERGHARAQHQLGVAFIDGQGVARDRAWGAHWVGQAASSGLASAQYTVGVLWSQGIGVPQDAVQGAAWLERARRQGSRTAAEVLRVVRPRLRAEQWRRARRLADGALEAPGRSRTRFVQVRLGELGYPAGVADGLWGRTSRAALQAFQRDQELAASGRLDSATLQRLRHRSLLDRLGLF